MNRGKSIKNKPVEQKVKSRCYKIRNNNIKKMTQAEQKVKDIFDSKGVKYVPQYPIYTRTSFILIDFYLPNKKLAIEIDGGSHIGRLKTWQSYNKWRESVIHKICTGLVRFTNDEILSNSDNFREFVLKIM